MLDVYIKLVKSGKKTLDEVPEKFRAAVKEVLGL